MPYIIISKYVIIIIMSMANMDIREMKLNVVTVHIGVPVCIHLNNR